jgi:transcriptional regulator with XRE-family HTH domain
MGKAGLQEKHHLALKLLSEARLSRDEIAKSCGMSKETLSNLCNGNVAASGNLALAFKAEYQKIVTRQTEDCDKLFKENKILALTMLNQRLRNLLPFKATREMTLEVASILNALARATPAIGISGGVHTHYHLTAEERRNEFKRLIAATAKDVRNQTHKTPGRGFTRGEGSSA